MKKDDGFFTDIDDRPVVIPKATIDLFLEQDEPLGLLGLYSFYYYTAIWQKTNQAKSSTSYAAKGLKISQKRIRRYKAKLIEIGLVEEVVKRTKDNAKISGHFIKVKYYQKKSTLTDLYRVENRQGNTYSSNNKTVARKRGHGLLGKPEVPPYRKYSIKLSKALAKKRKIMRKPNLSGWDKHFKSLNTKDEIKKRDISKTLTWYCRNIGGEYIPDIRSAKSFREKFDSLVAAKERDQKKVKKGTKDIVYKVNVS